MPFREFSPILLWLAAFALSLGCLLRIGAELFLSRSRRRCEHWILGVVLSGVFLLAMGDAWCGFSDSSGEWQLLKRAAVLCLAVLGSGLLVAAPVILTRVKVRNVWGLACICLAAVFLSGGRFYALSSPEPDDLAAWESPSPADHLCVSSEYVGVTDRQLPLALHEYKIPPGVREPWYVEGTPPNYLGKVILTNRSDYRSNCHGWVFAQGRFSIRSALVEQILVDNNYEPVLKPEVNDLIIHRDPSGKIIHSGVVRACGNDNFVLIESKWGLLRRYLHEPKVQCYSPTFTYYRSPRREHTLQIKRITPAVNPGEYSTPEFVPEIVRGRPDERKAIELGAE